MEHYRRPSDHWADMEAAFAGMDPDEIIDDPSHFMGPYGDDDWSESGHHDYRRDAQM